MRGQVTLPVVLTAFILVIVIANLMPTLYNTISGATDVMDSQTKLLAYLLPLFFLLGPALMALGYYNITRQERGGGGW